MYFIVGKTINQNKQVLSYLITDGEGIREVASQQVYVEYQNGNLPYLKGFNTNTGEVDFKNIDNSLIPTFYNGRGINNNASVLKILEENNKQIGVRILVASGKIMNVSLSDIIKLVSSNKIQLFNAKIVNNKVVMKYADTTVVKASGGGNKEEVTINNYDKSKFVIDDNLRLIKYTGNDKEVIIPKGVTSIEDYAFEKYTSLKSINIPNSVTSIGKYAFYGCTSLTSIIIPDSVTSIGDDAFDYCTSLTSITIGNSVTSIEGGAFYKCTSLTSIAIPNSVISIGNGTFNFCKSLESITITDSVTSIGYGAFFDCKSLESITVDAANKNYCSVDGVLFSKDRTSIICCPGGKTGTYTIPNSVKGIGYGAFVGCTSLTNIIIPDSVTSIESSAFSGCTGLTSIIIPDSVTRIGNKVFNDCPNICIKGVHGSMAEKYARQNNIKFEVII